MVSFATPVHLWWLVLPALGAALLWWRHAQRLRQQRELASRGVWYRVLGGQPATGLVRMAAWTAAAALAIVGAARPQWGEEAAVETVRTRDLVAVIDVSDSMRCADTPPSRLERSRQLLQRALPSLVGNRIGVVTFAGEPYPLVPLTEDLHAVGTFLSAVEPGVLGLGVPNILPGSNVERALGAATELLPDAGTGRVVVLLTDGENLQGDLDAATEQLKDAGVVVVGVVAGTENGGLIPMPAPGGGTQYKLDQEGRPVVTRAHPEMLEDLAEATGGTVVRLGAPNGVARLADAVEEVGARDSESASRVRRKERFAPFLVASALLVLVGFLASPWRRLAPAVLALALLSPAATAQAPAPSTAQGPTGAGPPEGGEKAPEPTEVSWWQRLLPGGERRLARRGVESWQAGEVEEAREAFSSALQLAPETPDRLFDLGTVVAAEGELQRAQELLQGAAAGRPAESLYNLGTAALQAQNAQLAVEALQQALLQAPDDSDVKRNYELARRLLRQQQQQQQEDQEQQDQEQEQQEEEQEPQQQNQEEKDEEQEQQQNQQPAPTPTPAPSEALYGALERAEAEAREQLPKPQPQSRSVEKDW